MFISNLIHKKLRENNKINKIHYGNAPLVSIKSREYIVQLSDCRLLKKNSLPGGTWFRDIYERIYSVKFVTTVIWSMIHFSTEEEGSLTRQCELNFLRVSFTLHAMPFH
jgi:hypothetical protein